MSIRDWFSNLISNRGVEDALYPRLSARKCRQCSFWTHRTGRFGSDVFYYWLPRVIGDPIGRTGSPQEKRIKRKAYGELWLQGEYLAHAGGGAVVVPLQASGYFDDYDSTECPVCDAPYSEWADVNVVCRKCRGNARIVDEERVSVRCRRCGPIDHVQGIDFEPRVSDLAPG
jgi:hypothetical protein